MGEVAVATDLKEYASQFPSTGPSSPVKAKGILQFYAPVDVGWVRLTLLNLRNTLRYSQLVIFCYDKLRCDRLAGSLRCDGIRAESLSMQMGIEHCQETVRKFSNYEIHALITSEGWPEGLDAAKVPLVIFYGLPVEAELYSRQLGTGSFDQAISIILALPFQLPHIHVLEEKCSTKISRMPLNVDEAKKLTLDI